MVAISLVSVWVWLLIALIMIMECGLLTFVITSVRSCTLRSQVSILINYFIGWLLLQWFLQYYSIVIIIRTHRAIASISSAILYNTYLWLGIEIDHPFVIIIGVVRSWLLIMTNLDVSTCIIFFFFIASTYQVVKLRRWL